ncbi:unnamed protein product [Moneuplotes crassus]|uniref:LITAF domain-containing protein n=1 Tax=Euplotes crassus TaxID=5936 RepID=A0AAD1XWL3_EUPCR|nr:unnamed protein product [Moneuplotes crassus]
MAPQNPPHNYPPPPPVQATGQHPTEPAQYPTSQPVANPAYQGIPQPQPAPNQRYPPQQFGSGGSAPRATPAMFRGVVTSVFCECPSCGQATHTRVEQENSAMQWILCLIMFIVGLWCCCFIPFCVDSMKAGNHYCSNCGSSIGLIQG